MDAIIKYIEARNRETRGTDDFQAWVSDGITQQMDNTSARLLLNYLAAGEDVKAATLLREFFHAEYAQRAKDYFTEVA